MPKQKAAGRKGRWKEGRNLTVLYKPHLSAVSMQCLCSVSPCFHPPTPVPPIQASSPSVTITSQSPVVSPPRRFYRGKGREKRLDGGGKCLLVMIRDY